MALRTANGLYKYDSIRRGKTLNDWVQVLHQHNCDEQKWNFSPLKPGGCGFGNLVMTVVYVADADPQCRNNIEFLSDVIHKAWVANYCFWASNSPWETGPYTRPFKPIGNDQRDESSRTDYDKLPEDEKEKDRVLARFLSIHI